MFYSLSTYVYGVPVLLPSYGWLKSTANIVSSVPPESILGSVVPSMSSTVLVPLAGSSESLCILFAMALWVSSYISICLMYQFGLCLIGVDALVGSSVYRCKLRYQPGFQCSESASVIVSAEVLLKK